MNKIFSLLILLILLSSCRAMFPILPSNKVLAKEIKSMAVIDQKYRGRWLKEGKIDCMPIEQFIKNVDKVKGKNFTFTKESINKIWQEQHIIDSMNVIKFIELVEEHGFPTDKKIGGMNYNGNLITLVLHFSHHENLVGKHIKEAALKGDFPKGQYMYFHDRAQIVKNKPCLYNFKPGLCKETMDEELTYEARKEFGMLEYFEKKDSKKSK